MSFSSSKLIEITSRRRTVSKKRRSLRAREWGMVPMTVLTPCKWMHAEALTRDNLSRRPVLPFRDVYDDEDVWERAWAKNLPTVIGTNINKAIENPPGSASPGFPHSGTDVNVA